MHLLIASAPRAGSHMIRSMLARDAGAVDIGSYLWPSESKAAEPLPLDAVADGARLGPYLGRRIAAVPVGRTLVAGLCARYVPIIAANLAIVQKRQAAVLHLYRRDRLAQVASLLLVMAYGCKTSAAPADATLDVDVDYALEIAGEIAAVDGAIVPYQDAAIAYEDLTIDALAAALKPLDVALTPGAAATAICAPAPVGKYVTNYAEVRAAFDKAGF